MSRSLNKAILIGNVGSDPEVRSVGSGSRVAQFSLATGRSWTDPSGAKQEKTEWHRCVVWNNRAGTLADVVEKYVRKGERVYVEGEIEYRQWQDKDGQTRYTTEIKVRELILLGGRSGGGGGDDESDSSARRTAPRSRAGAGGSGGAGGAGGGGGKGGDNDDDFSDFPGALEDEDDNLPF